MGLTVKPDSIDIEVECQMCGTGLDISYNPGRGVLKVDPCEYCMEQKDEAIKRLEERLENSDQ